MHQAISFAFHLMMKGCKKKKKVRVSGSEDSGKKAAQESIFIQITVVKIVTGNKFLRFFIIDSVM